MPVGVPIEASQLHVDTVREDVVTVELVCAEVAHAVVGSRDTTLDPADQVNTKSVRHSSSERDRHDGGDQEQLGADHLDRGRHRQLVQRIAGRYARHAGHSAGF